jgi:hypothetical protein
MTTTIHEEIRELARQIESMSMALERLYALLTEKPAGARRRVKLAPAQLADIDKSRAFKARVARAAKRYGVPLEEWIERFGPVDRLPPGVPRPAAKLPVAPYRRPARKSG